MARWVKDSDHKTILERLARANLRWRWVLNSRSGFERCAWWELGKVQNDSGISELAVRD